MSPSRAFVAVAALTLSSAALADIAPMEPQAVPAVGEPASPPVAEPPAPAPQHPQGIEKALPTGVIEGGWSYVYASYAVALLGLALYAWSLWTRRPGAQPPPGGAP